MKRVFNLIIVDESGSMSVIEEQARAGINETLSTIAKMQKHHPDIEQYVTLITFDSSHLRYVFDNVHTASTHFLTKKEYRPGGATPLYDAIGTGVSKLNAQVKSDDNVLVTIITDGMENCSREYDLKMVKNLIEKLKKQEWTFTLIGTDNLDVEGMANDMAIDDSLSFAETPEETAKMFFENATCLKYYNEDVAMERKSEPGKFFKRKK